MKGKGKKKEEKEEEERRGLQVVGERRQGDGTIKWNTLEHNGVIFPPTLRTFA
jgi:DNA topoisomerase-1